MRGEMRLMGLHWTPMVDGAGDSRRAALSRLQSKARRRWAWGAEGYYWAPVRLAGYVLATVAVSVLATLAIAG